MTNYVKQAKRIYKEVIDKHPKGAITITTSFRLKHKSVEEMTYLTASLRKLNKDLQWSWNWSEVGKMRIHCVQRQT